MTSTAAQTLDEPQVVALGRDVGRFWWLWLVTGIAWIVASLVILQFDQASVTTVGIIVGCMFLVAGVQQIALAALPSALRWLWALFGGLFLSAASSASSIPQNTFAGARRHARLPVPARRRVVDDPRVPRAGRQPAVVDRPDRRHPDVILAFWTSGQFFIHKAYVLLVFAGIWALMQGITDIVRAFQVRKLQQL